jgi:UDPglucose 6-dehydrogenase
MKTRYSVVGLGKLGASMTAAIASRGYEVIGMDTDRHAVEMLNASQAPVQETDLGQMIRENHERLRATLDYREAILSSDVTFVVVPTPSDERGAFSLAYAAQAFRGIGRALADKSEYHNVVLTSTVLPGSTRYGLLPLLEQESGKTCGADFGLCYSPEFIALGSVIHDFLNPDFNLVGEFDTRSGDQLEACYAEVMENAPPCQRMSIENAELAKVALNTFVTTKIAFANMLADLCERIPGGDVDVVTDALGLDRRIGRRYLTGALGYGGPCFPRDNVALSFIARELGTCADLAETTDRMNRAIPDKLVKRLNLIIEPGTTVAILGLAYKPMSHVTEESQGFYLAKALAEAGLDVIAYDPLAGETNCHELSGLVTVADSIAECLAQARTVLITTPDPAFKALQQSDFAGGRYTVVDFWRILDKELEGEPDIDYIPIGRSVKDDRNTARLIKMWGHSS